MAPITWNAGRSPFGRIGSTLAEVWALLAADEQRGVDAARSSSSSSRSPSGSRADRAGAAHLRAELRQRERGAAGRAGRRGPDLLDQLAALALGDHLDRPGEHVEDVDAHRDRPHRLAHRSASSRRRAVAVAARQRGLDHRRALVLVERARLPTAAARQ